jgi:3-keto-L-gulonate-6-phosphate decarboxylase
MNDISIELWQQRRDWIDQELEEAEVGVHDTCDHAVALFFDMAIAYCAGAWISVIVMSVSVIDAHLREVEAMNDKIGTAKLLNDYYIGDNINWLRKLRNSYVHFDTDNPVLGMNAHFENQEQMEKDATMAIEMTIKALFQNPGW